MQLVGRDGVLLRGFVGQAGLPFVLDQAAAFWLLGIRPLLYVI